MIEIYFKVLCVNQNVELRVTTLAEIDRKRSYRCMAIDNFEKEGPNHVRNKAHSPNFAQYVDNFIFIGCR